MSAHAAASTAALTTSDPDELVCLSVLAGHINTGTERPIGVKALRKWVEAGRLKAVRLGTRIVTRRSWFDEAIEGQQAPAPATTKPTTRRNTTTSRKPSKAATARAARSTSFLRDRGLIT